MSRTAAAACARTIFRAPTALTNASRPAKSFCSPAAHPSQKGTRCRPAFRLPRPNTTAIASRYPVELSSSLLSIMPLHSANASALLRSMLSSSSPAAGDGFLKMGRILSRRGVKSLYLPCISFLDRFLRI